MHHEAVLETVLIVQFDDVLSYSLLQARTGLQLAKNQFKITECVCLDVVSSFRYDLQLGYFYTWKEAIMKRTLKYIRNHILGLRR